jgi:hypothetical protein
MSNDLPDTQFTVDLHDDPQSDRRVSITVFLSEKTWGALIASRREEIPESMKATCDSEQAIDRLATELLFSGMVEMEWLHRVAIPAAMADPDSGYHDPYDDVPF